MSEKRARRVSAFVTIVALLYFFGKLISVYGFAGIVGSLLAIGFVATIFILLAKRKGR